MGNAPQIKSDETLRMTPVVSGARPADGIFPCCSLSTPGAYGADNGWVQFLPIRHCR